MSDFFQLSIEYIAKIHAEFFAVLDSGAELVINFDDCSELDLSGLQLLVSIIRESKQKKKKVRFIGNLKKELSQFLFLSGVCEVGCLTGEELQKNLKAVL